MATHRDSFGTRATLAVGGRELVIHRLPVLGERAARLPISLRILLENLLRNEDGRTYTRDHVESMLAWEPGRQPDREVPFMPARVILQDFTGVPAIVDLAAMRDAMRAMGGDPARINPLQPVDLVIDHSVQVDAFGSPAAFRTNVELEYERNRERYAFLRWGQQAFDRFRVVPPGTGIVHQVNLEYLASVVCTREIDGATVAFPDTVLGTDSHTTMINGLGVVGWGVGGIEAEAAMLGQPTVMLIPQVVGFRLHGTLPAAATATDVVLTVTADAAQEGRRRQVRRVLRPWAGEPLARRSRHDRQHGARVRGDDRASSPSTTRRWRTCASRAAIRRSSRWSRPTPRRRGCSARRPRPIRCSATASSSIWRRSNRRSRARSGRRTVCPLKTAKAAWRTSLADFLKGGKTKADVTEPVAMNGTSGTVGHGSVVIAAITSCTNTSNPSVMLGAGLLARKAVQRGLRVKPWVKTSLAPGSKVVTRYLTDAGVLADLAALGFELVGYGCTTCIGNSGPLPETVAHAVEHGDLVAAAVLSGNRNFEGRVNPQVRANYLASPPLVVAYALAGTMDIDPYTEPLGTGTDGQPVYLRDVWPTEAELRTALAAVSAERFREEYAHVFEGDAMWKGMPAPSGDRYAWDAASTYIKSPPFFEGMTREPKPTSDVRGARVLALLGDSITTDHISPAGSIKADSPAGH